MSSLTDVAAALCKAQNIVITGHIMPDGDSIGSTLALGMGLEKLRKNVVMVIPDGIPENYRFLPGVERVYKQLPSGDYDTFVVVDCSVPDRISEHLSMLLRDGITVVNIDHHANKQNFADVNHVNSDAAATGEIIYDLLVKMGIDIDIDMAISLYTAIVTDTGSFKYEGTTSDTHRRVAALLEKGIPVARVSKSIFDEKPIEALKVLQRALPTLCISSCGRVAWISLDWPTRVSIGAKDEHIEDLVTYPRIIKGVEVALVFKAMSVKSVKISLRSNYYVDVNRLAGKFGGGGHKRAAGCLISGDFEEVKKKVIAAAIEAVKEG